MEKNLALPKESFGLRPQLLEGSRCLGRVLTTSDLRVGQATLNTLRAGAGHTRNTNHTVQSGGFESCGISVPGI